MSSTLSDNCFGRLLGIFSASEGLIINIKQNSLFWVGRGKGVFITERGITYRTQLAYEMIINHDLLFNGSVKTILFLFAAKRHLPPFSSAAVRGSVAVSRLLL